MIKERELAKVLPTGETEHIAEEKGLVFHYWVNLSPNLETRRFGNTPTKAVLLLCMSGFAEQEKPQAPQM